ncbi:TylF/MycF/NovP-related O-methyltransferase [Sphingomonas sp.]|jgi:hypothetical protein|uniref:TylF/MycF/NovP-related O-methyltransferase n=1 Tax=Sphingomonas sp. TaxID=28214 RepID=UPI002E33996F|nr:TylF/MycF/NovP-related O-methyltransferase [Sphingomonas sp.]HEX4695430.1 TylF/MycF/NovP-related O-methyltransferase [Sphingomonas sp.]
MNPALKRERTNWRGLPGRLMRSLLARRGSIAAPLGPEWQADLALIRDTRKRVALLLNDAAALQIRIAVRTAARLDGAMAEAGVLMGGSARLIAEAKGDALLYLFDVFDTLQGAAPGGFSSEAEVRGHFGTTHGALAMVEALLSPYPDIRIRPGVFPSTASGLGEERFSFVHLDLDLPGATRDALDFFHPRLVAGGILIGDDYKDREVREVFTAFFAGKADTVMPLPWGQVMIVRQG